MASAGTGGGSLPPNFLLTPQQQNLLFAALNSNQQANNAGSSLNNNKNVFGSPNSFKSPPGQNFDGSPSIQDSPFLDNLDYDFGDSSFDFSFASNDATVTNGDNADSAKSDTSDNDGAEKRSHPDDDDDEDESPGSKRRESTDKVPKKPGRKPLTNEPSSVRKHKCLQF